MDGTNDELNGDSVWKPHSSLSLNKNSRILTSTSSTRVRKTSKKRIAKVLKSAASKKKLTDMRKKWILEVNQITDHELQKLTCCKKEWFHHCDIKFLLEKMILYRSASNDIRRQQLYHMATSNGSYHFDSLEVCSSFLEQSFRFSRDLVVKMRRPDPKIVNAFSESILRSLSSSSKERASSVDMVEPFLFDTILIFMHQLAKETADSMPDCNEKHLPFMRKTDVYEIYVREFKETYVNRVPASHSYFMDMWNLHCSNIKVRKCSRFKKCSLCEQLRSALEEARKAGKVTEELLAQKESHHAFIARERQEYFRKQVLADRHPQKYLSVAIDGADQSAFCLPHFCNGIKDSRGHGMKVHLIGLLRHQKKNHLRLFTMTDNHSTGANHIIEVLHRFINELSALGDLPPILFIQLDNCVRENKNKYLLSFLE